MQVVQSAPASKVGHYRAVATERGWWEDYFLDLLERDDRLQGHVLDVGCGRALPRSSPGLAVLLQRCRQLDGVDPDLGIAEHPALRRRWNATFQEADIPPGAYDAIVSRFVAEHVKDPADFLPRAFEVLRPGGVLYAITPHALHPFSAISRGVQALSLKYGWRKVTDHPVNAYPAYYRLNRLGSIARASLRAGFECAEFHYLPCVQWDTYFPRPLRFFPHAYDRLIGTRFRRAAQLLLFKLEKGPLDADAVAAPASAPAG